MTRIAVPYFLNRATPDVDLVLPVDVTLHADLDDEPGWAPLLPLYDVVANAVAESVAADGWAAVISADCTTSLGTVAGLQRAGLDPAIVWYDAHGDVQTMETTTSGFLGGMPLRILVGYRPELAATALGLRAVAEERVVLVDARDLDPPEVEFLRDSPLRHLPVASVTPATLPEGPLYLHVDLDVVDPTELPEVRYPAPGGPSLAVVVESVRSVLATGQVVGVGFACTWRAGTVVSDHARALLTTILDGWVR
jgi:arginase